MKTLPGFALAVVSNGGFLATDFSANIGELFTSLPRSIFFSWISPTVMLVLSFLFADGDIKGCTRLLIPLLLDFVGDSGESLDCKLTPLRRLLMVSVGVAVSLVGEVSGVTLDTTCCFCLRIIEKVKDN